MNERGLTLVEVLVALGIFAAVSAIGVGALGLAANGSSQLEEVSTRTGEIERFRSLLRADLHQMVNREVREPEAQVPRPAFIGGKPLEDLLTENEGEALLAIVRSGWANPGAEQPRSELQAVIYLTREDQLIRRTRPFLDATVNTPVRDDVLLSGVKGLGIGFRENGEWREGAGAPGYPQDPVALRVTFEHPVYGAMEHRFMVETDR